MPPGTVDGYKISMLLQKLLLYIDIHNQVHMRRNYVTFCLDGGSVLLMAAKAEVVEKQISPSAAQRSADLLPLRRCEARRRES